MDLEEYRFPLFVDLKGKKVVVVGGGNIAMRRIGVLLRFGADVTVIAPEAQPLPENVTWLRRPYEKGDLRGALIATACTDSRDVNFAVGQEARELGIFASICDSKNESSFYFPAICTGDGLVAGVVSKGVEHHKTARAAREIRKVLEGLE